MKQRFVNPLIAEFFGDKVTHLSGVAGKSRGFVDHVLLHSRYRSVCEHILKPNCSDYQLNIAHLMEREPGSEAQLSAPGCLGVETFATYDRRSAAGLPGSAVRFYRRQRCDLGGARQPSLER